MKKFLAFLVILFGTASITHAQCYGTVQFDVAASAGVTGNAGNTSFSITTSHCNELIMISYDGWNGPGAGPVTVDGNNATWINTANTGNSGSAMTYAYIAPTAGVHNIVCATSGYNFGYYINMAAAFYATGTGNPLTIGSLTSTINTISCTTGGSITQSIATTVPGSMVYTNCEINEGQPISYPISWTGATFLADEHTEDGIDASDAYGTAAVPGTYTYTATNSSPPANGCGGLTIVLVAIPPPLCGGGGGLSITDTKVDPTCADSNGSITISVTGGTAPYSYTWTPNVSTSSNATGLSAGTYVVTVNDANCSSGTDTITLINSGGMTVTATNTGNENCGGDSTGSATVTVTGGAGAYTYSWVPSGGTGTNATGLKAGTYTITVKDSTGCLNTASVTITEPPVLKDSLVAINISCNGMNDGSITSYASGGSPGYTYSWSNGLTTSAITGLSAGTYSITLSDANGCSNTANATIIEPPAITLSMSSVTAYCGQADGGATATAGGGTPAYTYAWSNGATTSSLTNILPGTYSVTVTDSRGCQDTASILVPNTSGETVNITAVANVSCNGGSNGTLTVTVTGGTSPYTYLWSNSQTSSVATGLSAGTYTVNVTDNTGCTASTSATISQPPPIKDTAVGAQTICIGQSVTLTDSVSGGTPGYKYSWSNGGTTSTITVSPVTTTTYSVTVTDVNGCTKGPVTVKVTVRPPLSITTTQPPAMCPGGTAAISATASGGDGNYTYTWYPGGTKGQSITVSPATTTVYTVVVNDGCGTPDDTGYVKVIIDPLPVVKFSADTLSGCAPFMCTTFADMTTIASGNLTSWVWNFGDGNTDSTQNPSHCYPNPGSYNVSLTVTSDSGCSATLSVPGMITVYSPPVANFSLSPQPVTIISPTIEFTDMSTDNYGIASWLWNFGDFTDSTSTYQYPRYTYKDTGTYCVTLRVTNIHGCSDSTVHCLVISPQYTLYIPDAFSPNGDGRNDIFQPEGSAITQYNLYIFDRWGNLIFHSTDLYKGWNGAVHNGSKVCQQDTYVYLVQITDNLGKKHSYLGKVTLIQ